MAEHWVNLRSLPGERPKNPTPDRDFLSTLPPAIPDPVQNMDRAFLAELPDVPQFVLADPEKIERSNILSSTLNMPFSAVYDNEEIISKEMDQVDPGWLKTAKNSFMRGWGNVYVNAARAAEWAGVPKSLTEDYLWFGERLRNSYMPPMKPEEFTFDKLLDARWWATTGVESVPPMLALIPAAIVGAYSSAGAAGAVGLGAFGKLVAGSIGGAALSRSLESAFEAGGTYEEALSKGETSDTAKERASFVFNRNLALGGVDAAQFALAFTPMRVLGGAANQTIARRIMSVAGKIGGVGLMEAGEEAYQAGIQQLARGDQMEWDAEMKEAAALGFVFGAGTGIGGSVFTTLTGRVENHLPPNLKEEFQANENAGFVMGKTPEEAKLFALDLLAESPEGKTFLEKELGDLKDIAEGGDPVPMTVQDMEKSLNAQVEEQEFTLGDEAPKEPDPLQGILADEDIDAIAKGESTIEEVFGMEPAIDPREESALRDLAVEYVDDIPEGDHAGLYVRGENRIRVKKRDNQFTQQFAQHHEEGHYLYDHLQGITVADIMEKNPELWAEAQKTSSVKSHWKGEKTPFGVDWVEALADLRAESKAKPENIGPQLSEFLLNEMRQPKKNIISDEAYEAAKASLKEKTKGLHAGVDPTILKDYAIIGAYHIERGVRDFAEWSKVMIRNIGDMTEAFLKQVWDASQERIANPPKESTETRELKPGDKLIPFRGSPEAVEAAANEHMTELAKSATGVDYRGTFYESAKIEGKNIRLIGESGEKLVRGTHEILLIEEHVPFDVPGEDVSERQRSRHAQKILNLIKKTEGATQPATEVKKQVRRTTGQERIVKMIREDQALRAAFKKAEQASQAAYKEGGKAGREAAKAEFREVIMNAKAKAEMFGFREGFKVAEKLTRKEFIAAFQDSQNTTKAVQKQMIEYVEENLPAEMRGRFLEAIINNVTPKKVSSVMNRVDQLKEKLTRKELIEEIKDLQEYKGERIAVEYKKRLDDLLGDIDTKQISRQTLLKLSGLIDYAEREGMPSGVSGRMRATLERLEQRQAADLTTEELQSLVNMGHHLRALGKVKLELKYKYNQRMREKAKAALVKSTHNLDPKLSGKNTQADKLKAGAVSIYLETVSGQRVPEMLDNYTDGENVRLFKEIWDAEQRANWAKRVALANAVTEFERAGVTNLTDEQQVRIMINIRNQEGADNATLALMEKFEYEEVPQLTPQEQSVIDIIKKYTNQDTDAIAALYEETRNEPFEKLDTRILPLKYEGDTYVSAEEAILDDHRRTTQTQQGFLIARKSGVKKMPRVDVFGIFEQALDEQKWYVNVQPALDNAARLVKTKEYVEAAGAAGANWWADHLDIVARRGWSSTAHYTPFSALLRQARGNLTKAILGYKLSTIVMQPFAIIDAMAYVQSRWGTTAALEVLKEFTNAWVVPGRSAETIAGSRKLQMRTGAGEVAIDELMRKQTNAFIKNAMKLIQMADVKTAAGVQKGLQNILERNGVDNAAHEAEMMTDMVSSSSDVSFRPHILARGEGARTWFTFGTFFLNRWSMLAHDLATKGVVKGDWKHKYTAMLGLAIIIAGKLAEDEARKYLFEMTTGKDIKERPILQDVLFALPQNIPIFGQIFSSVSGKGADIPLVKVIGDLLGASRAVTAKEPDAKARALLRSAEAAVAVGAGVPGTSQAFDIVERIFLPPKKGAKERVEVSR